jgi:ribosomal protein S18 acetylase RimI-like enzyme
MSLHIRAMCREDLPAVLLLLRDFAEFEDLAEYCTATEERFAAVLFDEGSFADGIIFENAGVVAGYAIFFPHFSSFRGERGMYLEDIYIKPEYRGGGTGRSAISRIAGIAASRGFERIDFQVHNTNLGAIGFYKRLGAESNDDETHFKFAGEAFAVLAKPA